MIHEKDLYSRYDKPAFGGESYDATLDLPRLTGQLKRTLEVMRDGRWRTLQEIAVAVGCTTQSASARLRDLRKSRYGSFTVERRRVGAAVFFYRLCEETPPAK
jgi:hypothetical protein